MYNITEFMVVMSMWTQKQTEKQEICGRQEMYIVVGSQRYNVQILTEEIQTPRCHKQICYKTSKAQTSMKTEENGTGWTRTVITGTRDR